MSESLFKVVFSGQLTGEFDAATSRRQFARLFKLPSDKIESLFSGKDYVIKNNVSEEMAMKFAIAIAEAGCETVVQPTLGEGEVARMLGFPDRRRGVRRFWIRRLPRQGQASDRRQLAGRRSADRRMGRPEYLTA